VDDDPMIQRMLAALVTEMGHQAWIAGDLHEGLQLAARQAVDLVFLDVRLPDGKGLEALPRFRRLASVPEVIIITGVLDETGAELAVTSGAWDYLQKPVAKQEIVLQIQRALDYHEKKSAVHPRIHLKRGDIYGHSASLSSCLDAVARCAGTAAGVLITGETGTGKELFARAIHFNSDRAERNFVVVDCAALPEKLLESILFGHVKGAFTGADRARQGLVAQADGGSLFLDEVGELSLEAQKSFLRLIQEKRFRPVGGDAEIESDFRLIAATHRDLEAMVEDGTFRGDLYFRLSAFKLHLPPLRQRSGDVEELTMHYVFNLCQKNRLAIKGVLPEVLEILAAYPWPGNVRQLVNTIEKAILADPHNPTIYPFHLPADIRIAHIRSAVDEKITAPAAFSEPDPLDFSSPLPPLKQFRRAAYGPIERRYLARLLRESGDDIQKACRISGLSRSRLYDLLKGHKLDPSASSASVSS
jgi:two-component system NtrC family response regulator